MDDLISREAAIKALRRAEALTKAFGYHNVIEAIREVPPAQPETDGFCTDCSEYDHERHFCPRFDRVIRTTVEEIKNNQWIPCSERMPEPERKSYWVCTDSGYQHECRWTNNKYGLGVGSDWGWCIFDIPQYTKVIAWQELPEPYKEDEQNG